MTRRPLKPILEKSILIQHQSRTFFDKAEEFASAIFETVFWISLYPAGQLLAWITEFKRIK